MNASSPLEIAAAFAAALDAEDYTSARALLQTECRYEFRGTTTVGADRIIAMYRASGDWAREAFEDVRYESEVAPIKSVVCRIRFRDLTRHGGAEHVHECEQVVEINVHNLICQIRHIDLPGQRESLERFMDRQNIPRRAQSTTGDNAPSVD